MKDKRIVVNPFRILSPKLDLEALKLEELYEKPVSESFTLDEGLVVMLSKLIQMNRIIRESFVHNSADGFEACQKLGSEVHQQEKMLTGALACSLTVPKDLCKTFILFPATLERIGDYLESILNCCNIKCKEDLLFDDRANEEVEAMFKATHDLMVNFRDCVIAPNKHLLEHVIAAAGALVQQCEDYQLAHVERLLVGDTAPRTSSLYLDILESTQSISRRFSEMAKKLLGLIENAES
jgi:Na+/phosphate symporter